MFPGIGQIAGLAMQLPSLINNFVTAGKQKRAANKIQVNDPTYAVSDYEKQNLANYQNAYNTGMLPGQAVQQQEIVDTAANTGASFGRNATSATQRMMAYGGLQGQRDASQRQLGAQFGQQKMGLLGGLGNALGRMTGEEQKVYQDKLRKAQEAQAAKSALMQSSMQNKANAFNTIGNLGAMVGTGELDITKLGGMFKGKAKTPGATPAMTSAMMGSPDFSMYAPQNTWGGMNAGSMSNSFAPSPLLPSYNSSYPPQVFPNFIRR